MGGFLMPGKYTKVAAGGSIIGRIFLKHPKY